MKVRWSPAYKIPVKCDPLCINKSRFLRHRQQEQEQNNLESQLNRNEIPTGMNGRGNKTKRENGIARRAFPITYSAPVLLHKIKQSHALISPLHDFSSRS